MSDSKEDINVAEEVVESQVNEDERVEEEECRESEEASKSHGTSTVLANRSVVDTRRSGSDSAVTVTVESKPTQSRSAKRVTHKRIRAMIRYIRHSRTSKEYYESRDVEAMKAEHAKMEDKHTHENCMINHLQSLVFGGVDGIITSFAIVAAIAGAGYSTFYILAIGTANLIADALSMGLGDYLSSESELRFTKRELQREEWEYDNYQAGEEAEMIELFMERGMTREDAEIVIRTTSKYKDIFCNEMMIHELGLTPPDDEESPAKKGFMTFVAFIICGIVPMIAYLFVDLDKTTSDYTFYIAVGLTAAALFVLGVLKSLTSYLSWYRSGFNIMVLGCFAAAAAFGISYLAEWAVESGKSADSIYCNTTANSTLESVIVDQ